jgi:hypothetical protein
MPSEQIDQYEIEYGGVALAACDGWAAHVAIYGPGTTPMHRNCLFTDQRVSVETIFPDEAAAEAEAHKVALEMLADHSAAGKPPAQG